VQHSKSGDTAFFHFSGHGGLLEPTGNLFKRSHKTYDETLFPLDHQVAGQIRDFSLYKHFVQPLAAGVTCLCIMDCCHSGSVLNLPYSYLPTPAGTIRMRQNVDFMTNLAFLYILAGGHLPAGGLFDGVVHNLQDVLGGSVEDYEGVGMEDTAAQDAGQYNIDNDAALPQEANGVEDSCDVSSRNGDFEDQDIDNDADYGGDRDHFDDGDEIQQRYWGAGEPQRDYSADGNYWDTGVGAGVKDDADVDCSCFADVLGALLDGDG